MGRSRPIPAHRRAPKLPDDRSRSFAFRIYEAAVRGLRRSRASGSLRLILARESPALQLVHVHFPKAGFELSEP